MGNKISIFISLQPTVNVIYYDSTYFLKNENQYENYFYSRQIIIDDLHIH